MTAGVTTLTDHNTALLTQREEQYQAMAATDTATAKLDNELTAYLKDYQERENRIKSAIVAGTAKEFRLEFADHLQLVN